MILFHGSSMEVKKPDLLHSDMGLDFGAGFYLTKNKSMAERWASRKQNSIVNIYEVNEEGCNVCNLKLDTDWLSFVSLNRILSFPSEYSEDFPYDIICGPTADDNLYRTVEEYCAGDISAQLAVKCLNALHYSEQYAIKTDTGIHYCKFLDSYELTSTQKSLRIRENANEKELSYKLTRQIKREYRNTGRETYYEKETALESIRNLLEKGRNTRIASNSWKEIQSISFDMENEQFDYYIPKSFGRAFAYAVTGLHKDVVSLATSLVLSSFFREYEEAYDIYSLSIYTIASKMLKALDNEKITVFINSDKTPAESAEWLGYLLMYWQMKYHPTKEELLSCDFEKLLSFYDIMHTTSIDYCIRSIPKDFQK